MPSVSHISRAGRIALRLASILALAACSGGDDAPTTPPPTGGSAGAAASVAILDGNGQTAPLGARLGVSPAVVVRDAGGQPVPNASVTFSVAAGGGSVAGATVTTDAGGVARVGGWTLGSTLGANTLHASVSGGANPQVDIGATARLPRWTFLVYLAADNSLAIPALQDLDEMESVASNPDVQVVVQAEFSPEQFQLAGATPQDANLPGFDTFRYRVRGDLAHRIGPDGTVQAIGNRAMTDPAQLREFVSWATTTYPAERTALVLWNHGGGFIGLIEDVTSTGSHLMSLADLPAALGGLGPIDVLDFDMCLMGGNETLQKMQGLARVAVFSQEVEPGEGDPYDAIVAGLGANPDMDAAALGRLIVEKYDASYANGRASTTKSAYDLSAYGAFATTLGTLATSLTANLGALRPALQSAIASSQKFDQPYFTDLVTFLDELEARTGDEALHAQIDAVRAQATGAGFRLATRARTGSADEATNVDRATGLHVTLPSGTYPDVLPDEGPGSLSAYQALFPDEPWTRFLTAWTTADVPAGYFDQGESTRFEAYLVWDSNAVPTGADIDLMILEPNGDLYIPFLGTVTPNGHLTGDSYDDDTFYEGYLTNRFVEAGRYQLYVLLFSDPQSYRPAYDVQYRMDQRQELSGLYAPDYPSLSLDVSFLDDPDFSLERVEAGAYTDLQLAAYADLGEQGVQGLGAVRSARGPAPMLRRAASPAASGRPTPRITRQQAATVQRALRARRTTAAQTPRRLVRTPSSAPVRQRMVGSGRAKVRVVAPRTGGRP